MDSHKKIQLLKVFFGMISVGMVYLAVATSFKSNLFEVLPALNREPWFVATLIDFYFNILIISAWVLYKEKALIAALWIVSFVCLGSITTALYVVLQLMKVKSSEENPWEKILLRKV
jgi:hypothetical protein